VKLSLKQIVWAATAASTVSSILVGLPLLVFISHEDPLLSIAVSVFFAALIFIGMIGVWYLTDGRPTDRLP
jgi:hypothetical protein